MKTKMLLENSTLTNIVNTINLGLLGIEDTDAILIYSKQKPGIVIKLITVEIPDYVLDVLSLPDFDIYRNKPINIESTLIDFIVFTVVEEPNYNDLDEEVEGTTMTLINMSLSEYMCSSSSMENVDSVDIPIWNLIEVVETEISQEEDGEQSDEKIIPILDVLEEARKKVVNKSFIDPLEEANFELLEELSQKETDQSQEKVDFTHDAFKSR